MAIVGISFEETKEYISKYDCDKDNPTKWIIGVLDSEMYGIIRDKLVTYKVNEGKPAEAPEVRMNLSTRNREAVKFGLKGVANFLDKKKNEIPFGTKKINFAGRQIEVVSDLFLNRIPADIVDELAEEILKENTLSEETAKNLL
jgi:hypothetical protein